MKVPMEEQLQQIPGPSSVLGTDGTRRWTLEFLCLKEDLSPPTGRGAVGEKKTQQRTTLPTIPVDQPPLTGAHGYHGDPYLLH